ncbi:MAG: tetratricopeptide repeat protein [bacterium]
MVKDTTLRQFQQIFSGPQGLNTQTMSYVIETKLGFMGKKLLTITPNHNESLKIDLKYIIEKVQKEVQEKGPGCLDNNISIFEDKPVSPFAHLSMEEQAKVWFYLAQESMKGAKYQLAINAYLNGLEIRPDYVDAHNDLAKAYFCNGQYEDAEKEYKRALEIAPDHAQIHYHLGFLYQHMNKTDLVQKYFERALELGFSNFEIHYKLGQIYFHDKEYKKAKIEFLNAVKLNPDDVSAHLQLANACLFSKEFELAEKENEILLKIISLPDLHFPDIFTDPIADRERHMKLASQDEAGWMGKIDLTEIGYNFAEQLKKLIPFAHFQRGVSSIILVRIADFARDHEGMAWFDVLRRLGGRRDLLTLGLYDNGNILLFIDGQPEQMRIWTLVHEVAHGVYHYFLNGYQRSEWGKIVKSLDIGDTDDNELFAELYACFVLYRSIFTLEAEKDPKVKILFEFMQKLFEQGY